MTTMMANQHPAGCYLVLPYLALCLVLLPTGSSNSTTVSPAPTTSDVAVSKTISPVQTTTGVTDTSVPTSTDVSVSTTVASIENITDFAGNSSVPTTYAPVRDTTDVDVSTTVTSIGHIPYVPGNSSVSQIVTPIRNITYGASNSSGCELQAAFDMAILLDSSGSVGNFDFARQTAFVAGLVSHFDVGPTQLQIAAATFDSDVYSQFSLPDYQDTQSVVKAIERIPYSGGGTDTHLALEFVREVVFAEGNGHRNGTPKVVLLATDGSSADREQTVREALKLKQEGVLIYPIAVGIGVNFDELREVATDPSDVFEIDSFDSIQRFLPSLQKSLCSELLAPPSVWNLSLPSSWTTDRPRTPTSISTLVTASVDKRIRSEDTAWYRTPWVIAVLVMASVFLVTSAVLYALFSTRLRFRKNRVDPGDTTPQTVTVV